MTDTATSLNNAIAAKGAALDQAAKDAALALAKALAACVAYEIATTTGRDYDLVLAQTLAEAPEMAELTLEAGYAFFEDSQSWGEDDE